MTKFRILSATAAVATSATLALGATPAGADALQAQALSITDYPSSQGPYVGNEGVLGVSGGASGNPVTFAVAPGSDGVCSASEIATDGGELRVRVRYLSAGSCKVVFDQAGNAEYAAAPTQQYTLNVFKNTAYATFFVPETASTGQPKDFSGFLNDSRNQPIEGEKFTFTDITSEPAVPLCEGTIGNFGFMSCDATFSTSGTHKVRASFDGGNHWQSSSFEQTVEVTDPPVVTTTSLPPASVGTPYSYQLQATGSGPLSFYVDSEISSWLTLDEDGTLHGTPTEADDTAVDVIVYDSVGGRTEARFTLVTNPVGKRTPTVSVSYTPRSIVAKVVGIGATPSGTAQFEIDGKSYGSLPLQANGEVTKPWNLTPGTRHTVRVFYSGDANYLTGEPGSVVRDDPTLTIAPDRAPNAKGWYTAPVTFTSTCTPTTAALTGACPAAVVYTTEGKARTFLRTIVATDGGSATTTVPAFNLDRTAPSIRLNGVSASATYTAQTLPKDAEAFAASDALSGLDKLVVRHSVGTSTVTYEALATDKAGNTRKLVVTAKYRGPKPVTA